MAILNYIYQGKCMSLRKFFFCGCGINSEKAKVSQEITAPIQADWIQPSQVLEPVISRFYAFPGAKLCGLEEISIHDIADVLDTAFNGTFVNYKLIEGIKTRGVKMTDLYDSLDKAKTAVEDNNPNYTFIEFHIPQQMLTNKIIKLSIEDIASIYQKTGHKIELNGVTLTGELILQTSGMNPLSAMSP
jgi:hypothetical protein